MYCHRPQRSTAPRSKQHRKVAKIVLRELAHSASAIRPNHKLHLGSLPSLTNISQLLTTLIPKKYNCTRTIITIFHVFALFECFGVCLGTFRKSFVLVRFYMGLEGSPFSFFEDFHLCFLFPAAPLSRVD